MRSASNSNGRPIRASTSPSTGRVPNGSHLCHCLIARTIALGTKRTIWDVRFSVDIEGKADTIARLSLAQSDPDSGADGIASSGCEGERQRDRLWLSKSQYCGETKKAQTFAAV